MQFMPAVFQDRSGSPTVLIMESCIKCKQIGMKYFLRGHVGIFVVKELNARTFGFCTVFYGGLVGYETVSAGSFDACAVR